MPVSVILFAIAAIVLFILFAFIGFSIMVTLFPHLRADRDREMEINWHILNNERVAQFLPDHKIEAIRAYRQLTGAGLAEAKRAVDYAAANLDALTERKARSAAESLSDAGVRELVAQGRINEATELYRRFADVDEYTAQDYITGIENDLRDAAN